MKRPGDLSGRPGRKMNTFCLVGRIASEPELHETSAGVTVCSVDLEVDRSSSAGGSRADTDRIRIDVWRGAAQTLASAARISGWVAVRGRIQSRRYEREGKTWTAYGFVAEKIEYLR